VIPASLASDALSVLLVVVSVVVISAVLQPFQIRLVRLLEGYWDGWSVTARLAPVFVEFQRRRLDALRTRWAEFDQLVLRDVDRQASPRDQWTRLRSRTRAESGRARTAERITRFPARPVSGLDGDPSDYGKEAATPLLPTALGNALRAIETSAGERYRLDTVHSWPRLYPHFSERFDALQASARDAMDTAANLTVSFFVVGVVAVAGLWQEPAFYWIPVVAMVLSGLSYVGAVAAAMQYGTHVRVAYDLFRFDMLKAMHYPLPADPEEEGEMFARLSEFLQAEESTDVEPYGLAAHMEIGEYEHPE
jgi:hypothetical protein